MTAEAHLYLLNGGCIAYGKDGPPRPLDLQEVVGDDAPEVSLCTLWQRSLHECSGGQARSMLPAEAQAQGQVLCSGGMPLGIAAGSVWLVSCK